MKGTEFFYEPCVDEAQTIRNMKRQLLFLKQYTASVSYTHLDVYKRQDNTGECLQHR